MESNALLFGYTGIYCDAVTCGYPLGNGYRMYLPELMRFNSPDSWSPFGKGGIHPYAYCEADPINHVDPSGHFAFLAGLGLQILAIGFMIMPAAHGVGVAAEEMAMPVLEAVDATTAATSEVTEGVGGVIPDAIASTSRATGAAEDLASAAEMPQLDDPHLLSTSQSTAAQPGRPWRPFDWDAPAPAPSRPTIPELIQRARVYVGQNPREVAAHYDSLLQSNVRGVRRPDGRKLLLHQLARELEREDVYAKDLQGFTTKKQLARDLGSSDRAFTDVRSNVRRSPGSRSQQAYVLHWFFNQQVDPRAEGVDLRED